MQTNPIETRPIDLSGLIVPVPTPFEESGAIDPRAFIEHLAFLAQHGVQRIMVNGTTAEFYSLLPDERKMLLNHPGACCNGPGTCTDPQRMI